jgi:ADP-heptose:LPS heptosyltransferase
VLCPFSTDKRSKERDFNAEDWNQTLKFLEQKDIKGVVINSGNDIVPKNSYLIDLSNLTKIEEAVEIVKAAKGYLGIDSWLSVLAAKVFNSLSLQIKSVNSHCLNNAAFYYAPKKEFNFINTKIESKI